ncbi:flavin-dependent oxidoreductase [Nocardia sp. NPDC003482]
MRVLIVGAGIAGLTTALSLHAVGIEATVVDGVTALRPLGVGINLLPHATAALSDLGLGDRLAESGIATAEVIHLDRFGNEIWREPRGLRAGHRCPQYSIHRGELQAILLGAVRSRLGSGAVRTGLRFVAAESDGTGVRVRLRDREADAETDLRADLVVGADGLHSTVRAGLYPDEGAPLWNGIRMWRGTTLTRPLLSGESMVIAGSNNAAKLVLYPISAAARRIGRSLVNWVAEVRTDDPGRRAADWNRVGCLADVAPHYRGWRVAGFDVEELMAGSERILEYPMVDRDPLPRWTFGRITLVGDAAHPMYPIGSNGGSQAVIDARILARELTRDPERGAAAYDALRRGLVNTLVLANRDMPMDHVLRLVAERAPTGFRRIEDVLGRDELRAITDGYRRTSIR